MTSIGDVPRLVTGGLLSGGGVADDPCGFGWSSDTSLLVCFPTFALLASASLLRSLTTLGRDRGPDCAPFGGLDGQLAHRLNETQADCSGSEATIWGSRMPSWEAVGTHVPCGWTLFYAVLIFACVGLLFNLCVSRIMQFPKRATSNKRVTSSMFFWLMPVVGSSPPYGSYHIPCLFQPVSGDSNCRNHAVDNAVFSNPSVFSLAAYESRVLIKAGRGKKKGGEEGASRGGRKNGKKQGVAFPSW